MLAGGVGSVAFPSFSPLLPQATRRMACHLPEPIAPAKELRGRPASPAAAATDLCRMVRSLSFSLSLSPRGERRF